MCWNFLSRIFVEMFVIQKGSLEETTEWVIENDKSNKPGLKTIFKLESGDEGTFAIWTSSQTVMEKLWSRDLVNKKVIIEGKLIRAIGCEYGLHG